MTRPLISDAELVSLKREGLRAMPDTVSVSRNTPTRGAGGSNPSWATVATAPCRLSASTLAAGGEQQAAGAFAGIMTYTLTVPAGTDINPADRVQVTTASDGSVTLFEVAAGKTAASWNMSDSWTLTEIQR